MCHFKDVCFYARQTAVVIPIADTATRARMQAELKECTGGNRKNYQWCKCFMSPTVVEITA